MPMIARLLTVFFVASVMAGCAHKEQITSIAGSECKIFEPPPYAVLGKTDYDQNYIDNTIEGGVGGCGWKRPAERPAELDAARSPGAGPDAKVLRPAKHAKKKRSIFRRIKEAVVRQKSAWPVDAKPVVASPLPIRVDPPPTTTPPRAPPRDAVDELLQPSN